MIQSEMVRRITHIVMCSPGNCQQSTETVASSVLILKVFICKIKEL